MNLNALPGLATTGEAGGLSDLPLDGSSLSSAFAQLLGARFLPAGGGKLPAAAPSADDPQAPALSRSQLNALLATFGERDGLLATALPCGDRAVNAPADRRQPDAQQSAPPATAADGELDAATLQALFAMLPAALAAQPPVASGQHHPSAVTDDGAEPSTGSLLSAAAPTARPTEAQPGAQPPGKPGPNADNGVAGPAQPPAERPDLAQPKPGNESQQAATFGHAMAPPTGSPLQPAPAPVGAPVSAPPTPQLSAQLGSPEWQQALSQQVLMFHRNGQQSAELRLHPQELGALQITLKLDDQQAQLHIASAHGQVRAAVEAAMPQLRHALAESGISLGQSSVGGEPAPHGQHGQQQAADGQGGASYAERHGDANSAVEIVSAPAALQRMAGAVNGVDIFA
ncbi:flagellar hook-length control protein FliK [Serratia ficaria]|uniref:flagellar hook-length control protein FliK n=1 Tax=Serratia ficaria TaxID=61651 RepID=UPI00217AED2C|nr:flagellar hook-length control protein FliK [Serratia ficaria]CAI1566996.1 Flagellar hook-length control protein [Serratia ficaria]